MKTCHVCSQWDADKGASQMEAMIRDGISRPVKRYAMLPRDGTPAQVARSVYRDLRERKIKNYETL